MATRRRTVGRELERLIDRTIYPGFIRSQLTVFKEDGSIQQGAGKVVRARSDTNSNVAGTDRPAVLRCRRIDQKQNALYSVTARVPRFDLCLSPKDVDDDVVQIDTILEALEPGYPPPEIDERRRSRADVKYYESASTTEGSDDRGRKRAKAVEKE